MTSFNKQSKNIENNNINKKITTCIVIELNQHLFSWLRWFVTTSFYMLFAFIPFNAEKNHWQYWRHFFLSRTVMTPTFPLTIKKCVSNAIRTYRINCSEQKRTEMQKLKWELIASINDISSALAKNIAVDRSVMSLFLIAVFYSHLIRSLQIYATNFCIHTKHSDRME